MTHYSTRNPWQTLIFDEEAEFLDEFFGGRWKCTGHERNILLSEYLVKTDATIITSSLAQQPRQPSGRKSPQMASPSVPENTNETLPPELLGALLHKLGLNFDIKTNFDGLTRVYEAWCTHVPFDNVRKLIALGSGDNGLLPGAHAVDFLENWLDHGTGGTCWSSSNALYALVKSLGFDARRVAGSMRDVGVPGHGSVKVTIDLADWLVDSSMLQMYPMPLTDNYFVREDPLYGVEIEPGDGQHLIWFATPPYNDLFPCRLMLDPVDHDFYLERYEISRTRGPFNHHLSVRYNRDGIRTVLQGHTRHRMTSRGLQSEALTPDGLCDALRDEVGMSEEVVDRWVKSGALSAAFEPPLVPPAPIAGRPPSRR